MKKKGDIRPPPLKTYSPRQNCKFCRGQKQEPNLPKQENIVPGSNLNNNNRPTTRKHWSKFQHDKQQKDFPPKQGNNHSGSILNNNIYQKTREHSSRLLQQQRQEQHLPKYKGKCIQVTAQTTITTTKLTQKQGNIHPGSSPERSKHVSDHLHSLKISLAKTLTFCGSISVSNYKS